MPSTKLYQVDGFVPCPRSCILLIHNTSQDRFRLEVMGRYDSYEPEGGDEIVHFAVLSEFSPYFIFLDDESQHQAADAVVNLVVVATEVAIHRSMAYGHMVPSVLKKAFSKTIHFLKRFKDGCFITPIFMKKLWSLVYRTWGHVRTYKEWSLTKTIPLSPATDFVC